MGQDKLYGLGKDTFRLSENDLLTDADSGEVFSDVRLFPNGKLHHPMRDEPFTFDSSFRRLMRESFANIGLHVPVDFNHSSGMAPFMDRSQELGAAAGWITKLTSKADGLYAKIAWNESGLEAIRSGSYKYVSPEFQMESFNKATGSQEKVPKLAAVALTNRPFLENQTPIAASEILMALGFQKEATVPEKDDKKTSSEGVVTPSQDLTQFSDQLSKLTDGIDKVVTAVTGIDGRLKKLEDDTAAKFQDQENGQKKELIDTALTDGILLPAQREVFEDMAKGTTVEKFSEMLKGMAKSQTDLGIKPVKAKRASGGGGQDNDNKQLFGFSEDEVGFFEDALGMSAEQVHQFGQIEKYWIGSDKIQLSGNSRMFHAETLRDDKHTIKLNQNGVGQVVKLSASFDSGTEVKI